MKKSDFFQDRRAINEVTSTKSSKLQSYLRPLILIVCLYREETGAAVAAAADRGSGTGFIDRGYNFGSLSPYFLNTLQINWHGVPIALAKKWRGEI